MYLDNNQLIGEIPKEIRKLPHLLYLHLDNNQLLWKKVLKKIVNLPIKK